MKFLKIFKDYKKVTSIEDIKSVFFELLEDTEVEISILEFPNTDLYNYSDNYTKSAFIIPNKSGGNLTELTQGNHYKFTIEPMTYNAFGDIVEILDISLKYEHINNKTIAVAHFKTTSRIQKRLKASYLKVVSMTVKEPMAINQHAFLEIVCKMS